ncbi:MAG: ABC transporter substrate-binding protein [Desulfobulbus sp.]|nr:ABC transporter substrate-binding protein [Desulfobulbus sp.]
MLITSATGGAALLAAPYLNLHVRAADLASPLHIAIEFNAHAVPAYVAIERKLFEAEGLQVTAYASYITGASLAAALTRGDIDAAYICLVPTINAYANAGVPIKVVCGTHLYGYGLAVHPDRVQSVRDLEHADIRVGCLREGTAVDTVLQKAIERFELDKQKILPKVRRMHPAKSLLAVRAGQLDAVFLPEHWLTMTERFGFVVMLTARDIWPDMIGSVLVVKDSLITTTPHVVEKMVRATREATRWMNRHAAASAEIAAQYLSQENGKAPLVEGLDDEAEFRISRESMLRSMRNLDYINDLDGDMVQAIIDNAAALGNIRRPFAAGSLLDLQYIQQA